MTIVHEQDVAEAKAEAEAARHAMVDLEIQVEANAREAEKWRKQATVWRDRYERYDLPRSERRTARTQAVSEKQKIDDKISGLKKRLIVDGQRASQAVKRVWRLGRELARAVAKSARQRDEIVELRTMLKREIRNRERDREMFQAVLASERRRKARAT